jgi:hypothetical protein
MGLARARHAGSFSFLVVYQAAQRITPQWPQVSVERLTV